MVAPRATTGTPETTSDLATYTVWKTRYPGSGETCWTSSWETLYALIAEHGPKIFRGEKVHPGWSGARFDPVYRNNENVVSMTVLGLDYDEGKVSLDQAQATWGRYDGLIHTTKSYTPECPRFRVIMPLAREISPDEYALLWQFVVDGSGHDVDDSTKEACRFWYFPSRPASGDFQMLRLTGVRMDPHALLREAKRRKTTEQAEQQAQAQTGEYRSAASGAGREAKYAEAALEKECARSSSAGNGTRNATLFASSAAIGNLVGSGLLLEDHARRELEAAARRCGLSEHEARVTVDKGLRKGRATPRDVPRDPPANGNGAHTGAKGGPVSCPGPTEADPLRGLRHLGPLALVGREKLLEMARAPIPYVWNGIVVAGTIVVISGPPSEGKTTLLFLILAARACTGGPVELLGRHVAPAAPSKRIVLIEGEHGEASTARKLVKSLHLLEVSDDALDRFVVVARKQVQLNSPAWQDVVTLIGAGLVSDIALDTIARVAPGDANDEREQVSIFETVSAALEKTPPACEKPVAWLVAHNRKGGKGSDLSSVSGSTQRVGQADTVLMVEAAKDGGRVVSSQITFAKLREPPDEYPVPASFSIVKEDGKAKLVMGESEHDDRPLPERIVSVLEARGAQTKNALRELLKRSDDDVEAALTELFKARRIRSTEVKVRGRRRKGFELTGLSPDSPCGEGAPDFHRTRSGETGKDWE